jgi:two-component system response regulator CpxR
VSDAAPPTADILVIDDDAELCELLVDYLGAEGYRVEAVHDGLSGMARALEGRHQLVVLDVMLPGASGFEVLRRLRSESDVPVLMLTARGEDVDRIVGLEMGADDYLAKPFNPRELVARIRAVQRRAHTRQEAQAPPTIVIGDVQIDLVAKTAQRGGEALALTSAEYELLAALLRTAGSVVSRETLTGAVLGRAFLAADRAIDVHVSNLRRKLGPNASGRARIRSVRGVGYVYGSEP